MRSIRQMDSRLMVVYLVTCAWVYKNARKVVGINNSIEQEIIQFAQAIV